MDENFRPPRPLSKSTASFVAIGLSTLAVLFVLYLLNRGSRDSASALSAADLQKVNAARLRASAHPNRLNYPLYKAVDLGPIKPPWYFPLTYIGKNTVSFTGQSGVERPETVPATIERLTTAIAKFVPIAEAFERETPPPEEHAPVPPTANTWGGYNLAPILGPGNLRYGDGVTPFPLDEAKAMATKLVNDAWSKQEKGYADATMKNVPVGFNFTVKNFATLYSIADVGSLLPLQEAATGRIVKDFLENWLIGHLDDRASFDKRPIKPLSSIIEIDILSPIQSKTFQIPTPPRDPSTGLRRWPEDTKRMLQDIESWCVGEVHRANLGHPTSQAWRSQGYGLSFAGTSAAPTNGRMAPGMPTPGPGLQTRPTIRVPGRKP